MADLSIQPMTPLAVSSLLSDEVETEAGQRIGFIKDLIIDANIGAIEFAIVSVGGLFGIGSKLYAVPWLLFERKQTSFVLRNARQVLAQAARWDEDLGIAAEDAASASPGTEIGRYSNRN